MTKLNIRIQQALKGQISTSDLSGEEQAVFFEEFFILMQKNNTAEQEASFKKYLETH